MIAISNQERMTVQNFIAFLKTTDIYPKKYRLGFRENPDAPLGCCLEGAYASFLHLKTVPKAQNPKYIFFFVPPNFRQDPTDAGLVGLDLPTEVYSLTDFPVDWLSDKNEIYSIISAMGWQGRLTKHQNYYCHQRLDGQKGYTLNLQSLFDELENACWQDFINLFTYLLAITPYPRYS